MDRESYRAAQAKRAAAANRPVQAAHRTEAQAAAHPASTAHHVAKRKESRGKGKLVAIIIAVVVVAALVIGGYIAWTKLSGASGVPIDSGRYQAVFFTNGQVYFGKLTVINENYLKLTDIFYLQTQNNGSDTSSENPQKASDSKDDQGGSNVQLIKLGNEVHGPEDEMIIARDQMLFYENLKADGKVAQTIAQYKQ